MTLGIAVIGTLIALGGLFFTLLERRDRKRAVTSERKDRDEQVGLLRRQVEAVEAEGPGGRLSSVALGGAILCVGMLWVVAAAVVAISGAKSFGGAAGPPGV